MAKPTLLQSCTLNDNETSFLSIPHPGYVAMSVICLPLVLSVPLHQVPSARVRWCPLTRVSGVGGGQRVLLFTQQVQAQQPLGGTRRAAAHRDDGFVVLRYAETVTIYTGTQLCSPAFLHAIRIGYVGNVK